MIELQAVILQYLRAYERSTGKVILEILCEALPDVTEEEIKTATLNLIERLYPEDKRLIAYLKTNGSMRQPV